MQRVRLNLGLAVSIFIAPPDLVREDLLTRQIGMTLAVASPKPTFGPPRTDKVAALLDLLVSKPDYNQVMKICEKYP